MKTPKQVIHKLFEKLNVFEHQNIFIFSDVLKLFFNQPKSEIPNYTETLKLFIEDLAIFGKTIVLPSFTYQFSNTKKYDVIKTRPQTGALPNLLLNSQMFKRTYSPMTSHLISGNFVPKKFYECSKTTFGQDSIYQWLTENNALILNLGVPFTSQQGWVIVHHTEEIMKVPYRHFKKFDGEIFENSKYIGKCSQKHFVRTDHKQTDYSKVNSCLLKNKLITEGTVENIYANSVKAKDVCLVTENIIIKNPNALLA